MQELRIKKESLFMAQINTVFHVSIYHIQRNSHDVKLKHTRVNNPIFFFQIFRAIIYLSLSQ